ncbi:hypothetical protein [Kitasatospora sp. NPDC047058]|uniref:hypothetical protein n=1 Tax=Kitasatospora sp. NPDC047058 TaxID=3155620 RepID=UPI0033E32C42
MITPDRLRLLHVVIDPDLNEPGNVIVAQAGLGAGGILQRAGFLPGRASIYGHPSDPWEKADYRLPAGLTREQRDQAASTATEALRRAGFTVDLYEPMSTPVNTPLADAGECLGDRINALAEQVRCAPTTTEVAAALAELSAPGDGALYALHNALAAAASWADDLASEHEDLGDVAERLADLAEKTETIGRRLSFARGDLVGTHRTHPLRGRTAPGALPDPRMVAGPHPDMLQPWSSTDFGGKEQTTAAMRETAVESREFYEGVLAGRLTVDWHYVTSELGYLVAGVTDHRAGLSMHIVDEGGIVSLSETFASTAAASAAGPRFIETFEPLADAPEKVLTALRGRARAAASRSLRAAPPVGAAPTASGPAAPAPADRTHRR